LSQPPILETVNLTKRFGGLVAVDNVSVKVERNKITLLLGPNGAGKTTLVNLCTGVKKPDSGKVYFYPTPDRRVDITGWPSHRVYKLGFVRSFQIPQPFLALTVLENVLAAMSSVGEDPFSPVVRSKWVGEEEGNVERAYRILKLVGLEKFWNLEAHRLGAGQLKMLEVARALAANAKLVALDEPIGGTDPKYAHDIFTKLRELPGKVDVTFLIIEHRIDIALPYADYVYVMDRGRVIAEGKPDEVVNNPRVIEVYIGEKK
jgi:branched-chain amino acid transport system ATP-binding protein